MRDVRPFMQHSSLNSSYNKSLQVVYLLGLISRITTNINRLLMKAIVSKRVNRFPANVTTFRLCIDQSKKRGNNGEEA